MNIEKARFYFLKNEIHAECGETGETVTLEPEDIIITLELLQRRVAFARTSAQVLREAAEETRQL